MANPADLIMALSRMLGPKSAQAELIPESPEAAALIAQARKGPQGQIIRQVERIPQKVFVETSTRFRPRFRPSTNTVVTLPLGTSLQMRRSRLEESVVSPEELLGHELGHALFRNVANSLPFPVPLGHEDIPGPSGTMFSVPNRLGVDENIADKLAAIRSENRFLQNPRFQGTVNALTLEAIKRSMPPLPSEEVGFREAFIDPVVDFYAPIVQRLRSLVGQ